MTSKLTIFLRSDSRYTRRSLPAALEAGLTIEEIIAEFKTAPTIFRLDIGIHGDIYLSLAVA
jgi:hypothetical protein